MRPKERKQITKGAQTIKDIGEQPNAASTWYDPDSLYAELITINNNKYGKINYLHKHNMSLLQKL